MDACSQDAQGGMQFARGSSQGQGGNGGVDWLLIAQKGETGVVIIELKVALGGQKSGGLVLRWEVIGLQDVKRPSVVGEGEVKSGVGDEMVRGWGD